MPSIVFGHVNSVVGAVPPRELPKNLRAAKANALIVILPHEGKEGTGVGCGALGHFPHESPEKIAHGVHGLFEGLGKLGLNPEQFFGMGEAQVQSAISGLNLAPTAQKAAEGYFAQFASQGIPVIAGVHSHEGNVVSSIQAKNLGRLSLNSLVSLVVSTCSDARSDAKAGIELARAVLSEAGQGRAPPVRITLDSRLLAENARVQEPVEIVFHASSSPPDKRQGKRFAIVGDEFGLGQKISLAYALVHLPKRLGRITFEGIAPKVRAQVRAALGGKPTLGGIAIG